MATGKFIALYRVSTSKQARSGLGLDAQKAAVRAYLDGGNWQLIAEFVEVESGKKLRRSQLDAAIERCKMCAATLVISRFDRLTRNLSVLCKLRDNGIRFVAVDNANATELTVNILISVAQEEARLISERTKQALAASKARGTVLGGYRGGPVPDAHLGAKARQEAADGFAALVGPMMREMRESGLSLRQIAAKLTADSIQTVAGGQWTATAVRNVLQRVGA
jgi:DNA invertase Pin-like site-specific DNA recombinase